MRNKRVLFAAILIGAFVAGQIFFYRYMAGRVTELARDPLTQEDRAREVRLYMQAPLLFDLFVICGLIVWVAAWSRGIEDLREARTRNADLRRKLEKERSLDNADLRLRSMVEEAPSAMMLLDDEGRLLLANRVARNALRIDRRDVADVKFADLAPGAVANFADFRQMLEKSGPRALRLSLRNLQGGRFDATARPSLVPQEKNAAPLVAVCWEPSAGPAAPPEGELATAGVALVAHGEELSRALIESMLRRLGYAVLAAADGQEAVDLFAANRDRVTAVVLDQATPRMSGEAAAERIRQLSPRASILLFTGAVPESANTPPQVGTRYLSKPFRFEDFQLALENVISENRNREI